MNKTLLLSQARLSAFVTCRRRFYLRYLQRLPWPDLLLETSLRPAIERGQEFHKLLERYFLGLPVDPASIRDGQLRTWWQRFMESDFPLPPGRRLPELRLTVPAGPHFLIGRFDLVIVDSAHEHPFAHLYDWKTSRPRPTAELQEAWQTRLYLAMLAESGTSLTEGQVILHPDQVALTYWYVDDPLQPRTIMYTQDQHAQNWSEIQALVADIEDSLQQEHWSLTDNWSHCRTCAYQVYCGRQEAGTLERTLAEELAEYEFEPDFPLELEPESP